MLARFASEFQTGNRNGSEVVPPVDRQLVKRRDWEKKFNEPAATCARWVTGTTFLNSSNDANE